MTQLCVGQSGNTRSVNFMRTWYSSLEGHVSREISSIIELQRGRGEVCGGGVGGRGEGGRGGISYANVKTLLSDRAHRQN